MLATELPDSESLSRRVSFESRYGTCALFRVRSANALMQLASDNSDRLMFRPSTRRCPRLSVLYARSEPDGGMGQQRRLGQRGETGAGRVEPTVTRAEATCRRRPHPAEPCAAFPAERNQQQSLRKRCDRSSPFPHWSYLRSKPASAPAGSARTRQVDERELGLALLLAAALAEAVDSSDAQLQHRVRPRRNLVAVGGLGRPIHRTGLHVLHDLHIRAHLALDRALDVRALPRVLAHLQVGRRVRVEQVLHLLIVDLNVRDTEGVLALVVVPRGGHHLRHGRRHHPRRARLAQHSKSFAGARRTVREARAVVPGHHRPHHPPHQLLINLGRPALVPKGVIELIGLVLVVLQPKVVSAAHLVVRVPGEDLRVLGDRQAAVCALGALRP
eukprot:scaffold16646_cov129-Isochrysis_galbana.AAC.1